MVERGLQGSLSRSANMANAAVGALKSRVVQLSVELEDALSARALLEKAISENEKKSSEAMASLQDEYERVLEEKKLKSRSAMSELLGVVESLVRRKEELSTECKRELSKAMAKEEEARAAAAEETRSSRALAAADKAEWDRGATQRRTKFLDARTEEIRSMTVKGLEPEVRRLTRVHREERRTVEAERDQLLRKATEQAEEAYLRETSTLQASSRARVEALAEAERASAAECLSQVGASGGDRYAAAVKERSDALGRLRRSLEERGRADDEARAKAMKEARAEAQRAKVARGEARAKVRAQRKVLLDKGRLAVIAALEADQDAWERETREKHAEKVAVEAEARRKDLAANRDSRIDHRIRVLQASALDRETTERESADTEIAARRADHLVKAKALKDARGHWVDRRVNALAACAELTARIDQTNERHRDLAKRRLHLEELVNPARSKTEQMGAQRLLTTRDETALLDAQLSKLDELFKAASAATDARSHEFAETRRRIDGAWHEMKERHSCDLDEADAKAKSNLGRIDIEIKQITEALHTGRLRTSHLEVLLKTYDVAENAAATNNCKAVSAKTKGTGNHSRRQRMHSTEVGREGSTVRRERQQSTSTSSKSNAATVPLSTRRTIVTSRQDVS